MSHRQAVGRTHSPCIHVSVERTGAKCIPASTNSAWRANPGRATRRERARGRNRPSRRDSVVSSAASCGGVGGDERGHDRLSHRQPPQGGTQRADWLGLPGLAGERRLCRLPRSSPPAALSGPSGPRRPALAEDYYGAGSGFGRDLMRDLQRLIERVRDAKEDAQAVKRPMARIRVGLPAQPAQDREEGSQPRRWNPQRLERGRRHRLGPEPAADQQRGRARYATPSSLGASVSEPEPTKAAGSTPPASA